MSIWQNLLERTANPTNQYPGLVIDASIAVKWFSEEAGSISAANLLTAISDNELEAFAPSVILYEVGNALFKGKKYDQERIARALGELLRSEVRFVDLNADYLDFTVECMVKYKLTFYDAVYAGLARKLKVPLLTANPKDHNKIKEIKVLSLK